VERLVVRTRATAHMAARTILPSLVAAACLGWCGISASAAEPGDIPNVIGLTEGNAQAQLVAWNPRLVISTRPVPDDLPPGTDISVLLVAEQEPVDPSLDALTHVSRPEVRLTLQPGVPQLVGLTVDQAQDALTATGLVLEDRPDSSSTGGEATPGPPPGSPADASDVVVLQQPVPGTMVAFGDEVTVGLGPPARPGPPTSPAPEPPTASPPDHPRPSETYSSLEPPITVAMPGRFYPTELVRASAWIIAILAVILLVVASARRRRAAVATRDLRTRPVSGVRRRRRPSRCPQLRLRSDIGRSRL
jgi:hypothetical protein